LPAGFDLKRHYRSPVQIIYRRKLIRSSDPPVVWEMTDLALALLGPQVAERRGDEIDESNDRSRRVDQQLGLLEGEPRCSENGGAAEHSADLRPPIMVPPASIVGFDRRRPPGEESRAATSR